LIDLVGKEARAETEEYSTRSHHSTPLCTSDPAVVSVPDSVVLRFGRRSCSLDRSKPFKV